MPIQNKRFLGDGCYMEFDGFNIILTTSNGVITTNRIVLEPSVWKALVDYRKQLKDAYIKDGFDPRVVENVLG